MRHLGWLGFRRLLVGFGLIIVLAAPTPPRRLNVVIILADDLGWADLSCYGHRFNQTPSLDSLARVGIRFTQAYATCPVCSPSRASLLTGQAPARLGLTDWLPGRKAERGRTPGDKLTAADTRQFLPLETTTLAEVLRGVGYSTALIGKWHLGGRNYWPEHQGFDRVVGRPHSGSPISYFAPYQKGTNKSEDLTPTSKPGEYLTDRLTDEAIQFMKDQQEHPFFLMLSHHAVHIPIQPKPNALDRYNQRKQQFTNGPDINPAYAALLESLDQSVGRVMATLRTLGLTENTLVIFTSDNGGLHVQEGPLTPATTNAPLREGKGYVYEGGIRVPLLVYLPMSTQHAKAKAGQVSDAVVWGADFFPTVTKLASGSIPNTIPLDGEDISALFAGKKGRSRTLYWHYPHYSNQLSRPAAAIRSGNDKLILDYESGQAELYNLAADPGETRNLSSQRPQRTKDLLQQLVAWQSSMGAKLPTP